MNRNAIYIRILLVIVAIVVLLAFLDRNPQKSHQNTWVPSSFNPVGAGHLAFYETLKELKWPVERWRDPFSRLAATGSGNVLIVTRSPVKAQVPFSELELDLLNDWVSKGNTLLLLGALDATESPDLQAFLQKLGFVLAPKTDSLTDIVRTFNAQLESEVKVPMANGKEFLILPRRVPLPVEIPQGARILGGEPGQPFLVEVPDGAGRIICGNSAELLSNGWLGRGDNLVAVLGLIAPGGKGPKQLLFEESHHGYSAVYAFADLFSDKGLRFAGLLTLLGAATFFGSALVRFGPVVPLQRESGRSTLEFVDSIADLYLRADLRDETLQAVFHETHQRVLLRLNLPPTASHELIASRLAQAHPHLPKWKNLAKRFDSNDYMDGLPPTGWLRVARELIAIKSAMA